jgi:hypothetical protein
MPAWLLALAGLGLIALGQFFQGPPLAQRRAEARAEREAAKARHEERMAKHRALVQRPEYQALEKRHKELNEAANRADEAGEIARRDTLRDEAFAA